MKNLNMIVGVDYSVSSPAICICTGDFNIDNLRFYYATNKKQWQNKYLDGKIIGHIALNNKNNSDIERIDHLSTTINQCIIQNQVKNQVVTIGIEDYAFQGKGNITLLAENMGVLKYKFNNNGYQFMVYAPLTIKKFARQSFPEDLRRNDDGKLIKMDKLNMHTAFMYDTGINLIETFGLDELLTKSGQPSKSNPITDIVDAYFIAKYHNEEQVNNIENE